MTVDYTHPTLGEIVLEGPVTKGTNKCEDQN